MIVKVFLAGFGGQGVLSMGYTLAYAGMLDDKYVTYFPSYGAEVRGGTANCTVCVGDEEIASPIASEPEYIVALNKPSMIKFETWVTPGGLLFINSSLVDQLPSRTDIETVSVPANEIASEVADERAANMVMCGALVGRTGIVSEQAVSEALAKIFASKPKVRDASQKAFAAGARCLTRGGSK